MMIKEATRNPHLRSFRAVFACSGGFFLLLLMGQLASAAVKMHGLFTSGMILQRNKPAAVYGTANLGEVVTVQFAGQRKVGTADATRRWKVMLDPMDASTTGRTMTVTSSGGSNLSLTDILVGDIWILGGQSNMDHPFMLYEIAKQDIVGINNNQIRLFRTDHSKGKLAPQTEVVPHASYGGKWRNADQTYLNMFSPAGYYMADRLNRELNVPIGMIHAALGSTNIESWLPAFLVESTPEYEFMIGSQWPSNVMLQAEIDAGDEMARRGTSGLYNYTIAPLREFSFKGFAWYQGESNSRRPWAYRQALQDLITAWRQDFGNPNAPFLVVEIAPYGGYEYERAAWLREAQSLARQLPHTGYVTTVDIGEFVDIHPAAKKAVGERLAYAALEMDGLDYQGQPPSYQSMTLVGNTIEIDFSGATALSTKEVRMNRDPNLPVGEDPNAYVVPAGKVAGFEICAADQVFVTADAVISGGKVIVSAPGIHNPVAARYAWKNFPLANLTAEDGRVVPPFRTDDFVSPFHPPAFEIAQFKATTSIGAAFSASMPATDPNGGPLSYSMVSFDGPGANWLSIHPTSGEISGMPTTQGDFTWVISVRDQAFNDANSFNVAYATVEVTVGPFVADPDSFVYPTLISTSAGQFNSSTGIEKLVNAGFTSSSGFDDADGPLSDSYVSVSIANGLSLPAGIMMTFDEPMTLDAFHLWNHGAVSGNKGQQSFGVKDFSLEFYSDTAATKLIRSVTGLSAAAAPLTGAIPSQTFVFAEIQGVQAVKWIIASNYGGSFVAAREIAFHGSPYSPPPPAPLLYPLPASTTGGQFNSSTGIEKLVNAKFASASDFDSDSNGLDDSYVSISDANGLTYPVTLMMTFASAMDLSGFYLWNHANNNLADQTKFGVNGFDLELYNDTAATVLIRRFTGLSAAKAPQTGSIPAQIFTFDRVDGVRSIKMIVHSNHGGAFLAIREIALGAAPRMTASLSSFTYDRVTGESEVCISGAANTIYKLVEAADLDFANPDRNPISLTGATVGTLNGNQVTTDGSGKATVQFNLGAGLRRTFIRGERP